MKNFPALLALGALLWAMPATAVTSGEVPAVLQNLQRRFGVPEVPVGNQQAPAGGVARLLQAQRAHYPEAFVSGTFYDWRTVSRYRSQPGLHLGYDIAMPAGTPVAAAWPGMVVAVIPWSDGEWGVCVESPNGVRTTYGHVVPSVEAGAPVKPGTTLGRVSRDHLDVKMRDVSGDYLDFGENQQVAAMPVADSAESVLVEWLTAVQRARQAAVRWDDLARRRRSLKAERAALEPRIAELQKMTAWMATEAGQRLTEPDVRTDAVESLTGFQARVERIELGLARNTKDLEGCERERRLAKKAVDAAQEAARRRGLAWTDVVALVNRSVAEDPALQKKVRLYKKTVADAQARRTADVERKLERSQERLQHFQDLYAAGVLTREDLASAEEMVRLHRAELQDLRE